MSEAFVPYRPSAAVAARVHDRPPWARRGLLGLIRMYQRTLSPVPAALFGAACGCRFSPTCSHYAAGAVQLHGAFRGTWLTVFRLVKCTPLHPGGFDSVPMVKPRQPGARLACVRVSSPPLPSGLQPSTYFHG